MNFEGSSGSMDTTGLLNIFQRSIENYGIRYIKFLGDGNNKAHSLFKRLYMAMLRPKTCMCGPCPEKCSLRKRLGKTPLGTTNQLVAKGA